MSNPLIPINQLENVYWQLPDHNFSFSVSNSTDIWRVYIDDHIANIDIFFDQLSAEEKLKAERYRREGDKNRFIIGRACLRTLLSKYLDVQSQQIIFDLNENGKPYLKDHHKLHFNVSHSGNYILIAISNDEVGVDVEQINAKVHYRDIMEISFSQAEITYVNGASDPIESFFKLWTRKESFVKATGTGLDDHIKKLPVMDGEHIIENSFIPALKKNFVSGFVIDENHLAALATCNKTLRFVTYLYQ